MNWAQAKAENQLGDHSIWVGEDGGLCLGCHSNRGKRGQILDMSSRSKHHSQAVAREGKKEMKDDSKEFGDRVEMSTLPIP